QVHLACEVLLGLGDAGLGPTPPDVTDRQSHGVGRVGGTGWSLQAEDTRHHGADLLFARTPTAGDGRLGLAGDVQRHGQVPTGGAHQGHTTGLSGTHDGADVVLGEDSLDGHRVGPVFVEPGIDPPLDLYEPLWQVGVRRGA